VTLELTSEGVRACREERVQQAASTLTSAALKPALEGDCRARTTASGRRRKQLAENRVIAEHRKQLARHERVEALELAFAHDRPLRMRAREHI
jgi:hypothetical protein